MKNLLLVCLLVQSFTVYSQWRKVSTDTVDQTDFNYITSYKGIFYATAVSGVYSSKDAGFHWEHISSLYYQAGGTFFIDKYMFVQFLIRNKHYLLRTNNNGETWDTICKKYTLLRHLKKRIIISIGGETEYSDDYGNSFYALNAPDYLMKAVYLNFLQDTVGIKDSLVSGSKDSLKFYVTQDGVHAKKIFDTALFNAFWLPRYYGYDKGIVYLFLDEKIIAYDTLTSKISYLGFLPVSINISYNLFIEKMGDKYYFSAGGGVYTANADSLPLKWNTLQWVRSVEFNIPGHGILARSDSTRVLITKDTFKVVHNIGIPVFDVDVRKAGRDKILTYAAYKYLLADKEHPDSFRILDTAQIYYLPSLGHQRGEPSEKRSIMYIGKSLCISNDSGASWSILHYPDQHNYSIIAYNDKDIFATKDNKTLIASSDGGQSWFPADSGLDKDVFPGPYYVTEHGDGYLLLAQARFTNTHQAFICDKAGGLFIPYGNIISPDKTYYLDYVECTLSGTPLAIFTGSGIVQPIVYYFDTSLLGWKMADLRGVNLYAYPSFLVIKNRIVAADVYDGLYVSDDLGNTFYKDTSMPTGLLVYNPAVNHAYIGNTIYLSTSGGIWANSNFYNAAPDPVKRKDSAALKAKDIDLNIMPNPVADYYKISFSDSIKEDIYFQLNDVAGRICNTYHSTTTSGINTFTFDRNGLRKGMYFLRIKRMDGITVRKLILE